MTNIDHENIMKKARIADYISYLFNGSGPLWSIFISQRELMLNTETRIYSIAKFKGIQMYSQEMDEFKLKVVKYIYISMLNSGTEINLEVYEQD